MTAIPDTPSFEWTRGERLAKARKVAGFTQDTMAEMLTEHGVKATPFAIATWETDRSQPRKMMEVYEAWSKVTGAPMEWLLGLTGTRCFPPLSGVEDLRLPLDPFPPIRDELRVRGHLTPV